MMPSCMPWYSRESPHQTMVACSRNSYPPKPQIKQTSVLCTHPSLRCLDYRAIKWTNTCLLHDPSELPLCRAILCLTPPPTSYLGFPKFAFRDKGSSCAGNRCWIIPGSVFGPSFTVASAPPIRKGLLSCPQCLASCRHGHWVKAALKLKH